MERPSPFLSALSNGKQVRAAGSAHEIGEIHLNDNGENDISSIAASGYSRHSVLCQIGIFRAVDQSELGQRLRRARERIGMSQEALAEVTERDQKAISEYENGKRKLPAIALPTYARALGVPISYFFDDEFRVDDFDQLLLHEFHGLLSEEDKQAAIQAVRLIADVVQRHSIQTIE